MKMTSLFYLREWKRTSKSYFQNSQTKDDESADPGCERWIFPKENRLAAESLRAKCNSMRVYTTNLCLYMPHVISTKR